MDQPMHRRCFPIRQSPWTGLCKCPFFGDLYGICFTSASSIGDYPLVHWHNYGKSPFSMGKSTINGPFSIAMLAITRGYIPNGWVIWKVDTLKSKDPPWSRHGPAPLLWFGTIQLSLDLLRCFLFRLQPPLGLEQLRLGHGHPPCIQPNSGPYSYGKG